MSYGVTIGSQHSTVNRKAGFGACAQAAGDRQLQPAEVGVAWK